MTLTDQDKSLEKLSGINREIVNSIIDRKGKRVTVLDMDKLETAPAGSFIVCQGNSTSQVSAIADNIRENLREKLDLKPYNYEGYRNSEWIVIDYGNVMIHIFLPEFREYYNLEDLWSDADITEIPDLD